MFAPSLPPGSSRSCSYPWEDFSVVWRAVSLAHFDLPSHASRAGVGALESGVGGDPHNCGVEAVLLCAGKKKKREVESRDGLVKGGCFGFFFWVGRERGERRKGGKEEENIYVYCVVTHPMNNHIALKQSEFRAALDELEGELDQMPRPTQKSFYEIHKKLLQESAAVRQVVQHPQ